MSDTLVRATIISSDNFTMMHLLQTSSSLKLNHSQTKNKGFEGDFMSNVRYNDVYAIYINKKEDYLFYISIKFVLICWGVFNPTLDVNPCKTFSTTYAHNSLLTMSNKNNKIHLSTTTTISKYHRPVFFWIVKQLVTDNNIKNISSPRKWGINMYQMCICVSEEVCWLVINCPNELEEGNEKY